MSTAGSASRAPPPPEPPPAGTTGSAAAAGAPPTADAAPPLAAPVVPAAPGRAAAPDRLPWAAGALLGIALLADLAAGLHVVFSILATLLQLAATGALLRDGWRRRLGRAEGAGLRALVLDGSALVVLAVFALTRATLVGQRLFSVIAPDEAVRAARQYGAVIVLAGALALWLRRPSGRALLARLHLRPVQTMAAAFGAAILVGTLLLMLPFSVTSAARISLLDSLFMATSAVCVTGLAATEFPGSYTLFGQAVLLALVQAGGLGMMSLYAAAAAWKGPMSARAEEDLAAAAGHDWQRDLRGSLRFILLATLIVEGAGALLLYPALRAARPESGVWDAVFHAISAFCNAGFSTVPGGLVAVRSSPAVLLIVASLVVLGGLGYPVLLSLAGLVRRRRLARGFHVRLALATTALLLVVGFAGLLVLESGGVLREGSFLDRLAGAAFLSASARTAGFDAAGLDRVGGAGAAFLMCLMVVGASPASTGGGLKTTTFAVLGLALVAVLRRRTDVRALGRTVPPEDVLRASAVLVAGLAMASGGILLLLAVEPGLPPLPVAFEAVSAFTTTGLSLGATPSLGVAGRLVVIVLMFAGRLGPLALLSAFLVRRREGRVRYPRESVLFG